MNHTLCGSWVVHATCNCTAMYRLAVFFSLSSLPPSLLSSLSLQSLTQAEPMQQKQIIGEHLYRQIYTMHPDLSGKITGTVTACITDLKCLKHTLYTCVNKCWESNKNYSFNCILPLIPFLSLPFSSPFPPLPPQACCWRWITQNCCTCWRYLSPSSPRWRRLSLSSGKGV